MRRRGAQSSRASAVAAWCRIHIAPSLAVLACLLLAIPVEPAAASGSRSGTDHQQARPDIVVIMLDDVGPAPLDMWQHLPTIDRMFVEQGVRFTDYTGNDPLCCPGRANFLTGQLAIHHGVTRNDARLFDPRETIATELASVGYHTIIAGKYFNTMELLADKTPPGWSRAMIYPGGYWADTYWVQGRPLRTGLADSDYSTDVIARQALPWLRAAPRDQPVFLYLAPYATHGGRDQHRFLPWNQPAPAPRHVGDPRCADVQPYTSPAYNEADVSDKPAYIRRQPLLPIPEWSLVAWCEALLSVDETLARVEQEMERQGRDNVLYLLTADNGMGWGAHRWHAKVVPYAIPRRP
jgi:N-acetylglucosamine-6-sulfatase